MLLEPIWACRNGYWGKNIIIPEVDPTLILKLIEQEKIQHALFVPAVILFLLNI